MTSLLQGPDPAGLVHQALLYRTSAEFAAAVSDYIREGIAQDEVVVVTASPRNLEALRGSLTAAEAAAATLQSASDGYTHPGQALAAYYEMLTGHAGAGQKLRVVGEQPLTELHPDYVRELCRIDAVFNEVCAIPEVSVICPYDLTALPQQVIDHVRRSHPQVAHDGQSNESPHYRPAAEVLGRERGGPPLAAPRGQLRELIRPTRPAEVRAFVIDSVGQLGAEIDDLGDFLLAVNEIATNAFVHAEMDRVRVWTDAGRLLCEVRDRGPGIADPLAGYRQPASSGTAGRGMWVAHQLADLVDVRTGPTGTTVRLHSLTGTDPLDALTDQRSAPLADLVDDLRTGWFARPAEHLIDTVLSIGAPAVLEGRDGTVITANAAALALFAPELPGAASMSAARVWQRVTQPDGAPLDAAPSARTFWTGQRVSDIALRVSGASGEELAVLVSVAPVFRPGLDDPSAALVVFQPAAALAAGPEADPIGPARSGRAKQVRPRAFAEQVAAALARQPPGAVAVMRIDVDVIEGAVQGRGPAITEAALAIVGRRIMRALRPQDVFARLGRGRFAVLTVDVPPSELSGLTERVRRAVTRPVRLDEVDVLIQMQADVSARVAEAGDGAAQVLELTASREGTVPRQRTLPPTAQPDPRA